MQMNRQVERQEQLIDWVHQVINRTPLEIRFMQGDASFRRYGRVQTPEQRSYVIMDAPPSYENSQLFVDVAEIFLAANARVPEIIAHDASRGFMLLEDFGDTLLSQKLNENSAVSFYQQAIQQLISFQKHPIEQTLPAYAEQKLYSEMELFKDWFLSDLLNCQLSPEEASMLETVYAQLITNALRQPQVLVHRDYHCRNLMVLEQDHNLGIIDFQDAVMGAVTYDLVSLLRDAYVEWPDTLVNQLLHYYLNLAIQHHIFQQATFDQFKTWFDLMGAQRHLKVLGIFVRLAHRDGKLGYLQNIPLVFKYLITELQTYPEFINFTNWLKEKIVPVYEAKTGLTLQLT